MSYELHAQNWMQFLVLISLKVMWRLTSSWDAWFEIVTETLNQTFFHHFFFKSSAEFPCISDKPECIFRNWRLWMCFRMQSPVEHLAYWFFFLGYSYANCSMVMIYLVHTHTQNKQRNKQQTPLCIILAVISGIPLKWHISQFLLRRGGWWKRSLISWISMKIHSSHGFSSISFRMVNIF